MLLYRTMALVLVALGQVAGRCSRQRRTLPSSTNLELVSQILSRIRQSTRLLRYLRSQRLEATGGRGDLGVSFADEPSHIQLRSCNWSVDLRDNLGALGV